MKKKIVLIICYFLVFFLVISFASASFVDSFNNFFKNLFGGGSDKDFQGEGKLYSLGGSPIRLFLDPSIINVNNGEEFEIDVNVSDVVDLYGIQLDLTYNASILEYIEILEGDFLSSDGAGTFTWGPDTTTPGVLKNYLITRTSVANGIDGSGIVATVRFRAKNQGISNINLLNDILIDSDVNEIIHTTENSVVNVGIIECVDRDGDGFGVCPDCGIAKNCVYDGNDCNDANYSINPSATEVCDYVDNDCDALIDEGSVCNLCGNGIIDSGEVCDIGNLGGQTCISNGYDEGVLICCLVDCRKFDFYNCKNVTRTCTDYDGVDYFVKSNVTAGSGYNTGPDCDGLSSGGGGSGSLLDKCEAGILNEAICKPDNTAEYIDYNCPDGCSDGACVQFECHSDGECDDGLYCNGQETCVGGSCVAGTPVECDDGIACSEDSCNDGLDKCDFIPNNLLCDDSIGCTVDVCDINLGCSRTPDDSLCGPGEVCDSNLGCVPSQECTINSVQWSKTSAVEGEGVGILIDKQGDCSGVTAQLEIWELDFFSGDDQVSSIVININEPPFFISQFIEDEYGIPEYYFKVSYNSIIADSGKTANEVLKVYPGNRKIETRTIPLKTGKNVFTMPLIMDNMSVENVFGGILDKADRIYTYDTGWKVYNFNKTKPSNLFELKEGEGYVVFMKEDADLVVVGSKTYLNLSYPEIKINPNWSLVSIYYENYDAQGILGNPNNKLYRFNESTKTFKPITNPSEVLSGDESYWVFSSSEVEFSNPETGLPTASLWQRIKDFFKEAGK